MMFRVTFPKRAPSLSPLPPNTQADTLNNCILPGLRRHNVHVLSYDDLSPAEESALRVYFIEVGR